MSDSASKRIGENLLKGWTLLGENCPDGCNIPLMRSRDQSKLVCCECSKDFLKIEEKSTFREDKVILMKSSEAEKDSPSLYLQRAVDSKISWMADKIEKTCSVTDLADFVEVASKLVKLRGEL